MDDNDPYFIVKDKWNQVTADFMAKNVRDIGNWDGLLQEKHRKNQEQFDRVLIAKQRQKEIERDHIKRKYFLLHKWEFIKEKRQQYEKIAKEHNK